MSSNFKYTLFKSVKPYVRFVPQLSKPVLRVLIQVCVHYIESRKCSPEILDLALTKLTHNGNEIPENFCELFAAILQIMQIFLRTPKGSVKDEELREGLRELKFTEECIDDISKVLHNHRESLTKNFVEVKCLRSSPKRFQWKINISLIDSGISHLNQPTVIIHFQTVNDEIKTFELPLSMFHRLRYNVALLLKELQSWESINNKSLTRKN
ncbi:COMM domain-containing protein 5 [Condylostylus longicornis]|uniref:COMM domain-containing protein 5 n=1 Tax=Condylostylus longicornis TaxID=2530218 RepID=UPI00244DEF6C|nr:COMM domain-containing protein 5 [Condylostylus longicornis]